MKRTTQGFTLIELIIVIVILGILAVTAAPRFLDLSSDATGATLDAVEGSVKSAINVANGKALAQGQTGETGTTTNPALTMAYGYPVATLAMMQAILDIDSVAAATGSPAGSDWEIKAVSGSDPAEIRIYPVGDYDGETSGTAEQACYVTYTQAEDADTPPVVNVVKTGC